jgi:hypothetical protein
MSARVFDFEGLGKGVRVDEKDICGGKGRDEAL